MRALLLIALSLSACRDADLRAGDAALGRGDYGEAIRLYEQARQRLPKEQDPITSLASAHRTLGLYLARQGDCGEARTHFTTAANLTEPLLADERALYDCALRKGAPPETLLEDIARMLALGEDRTSVLLKRMQLGLEIGDDGVAVEHIDRLEKHYAVTPQARRALVEALLRLGYLEKAYPLLVRVVMQDPTDPLNRLKLAELMEGRGEVQQARKMYEALATDFRKSPVVFMRKAAFHRRQGERDAAIEATAKANALRGIFHQPRNLRPLRKSRR